MSPFPQTAVIEEFELFGYDERHDTVCQAFLEHQEPSDAPVPVLEGMDGLELLMQVNDILQRLCSLCVIGREQRFHPGMHLLRRAGGVPSHLVGEFLIVPNIEPGFTACGSACLQDPVNLLNQRLSQFVAGTVDDEVDATEMVCRLHNVIDVDTLIRNADGVRLKDEPGLFVGQTAALDVVGVIGEVDLGAVIDSPAYLSLLFFTKSLQQGALLGLPFPGKLSIGRDIPCLADIGK